MKKNIGKRVLSVVLSSLLVFNSSITGSKAIETEDKIGYQVETEDNAEESVSIEEENTEEESDSDQTEKIDQEESESTTLDIENIEDEKQTENESVSQEIDSDQQESEDQQEPEVPDQQETESVSQEIEETEDKNQQESVSQEIESTEDKKQEETESTSQEIKETEDSDQKESEEITQTTEQIQDPIQNENGEKEEVTAPMTPSPLAPDAVLDKDIMNIADNGGVENKHIATLANVILEESFDSAKNWTVGGSATIGNGAVTFNQSGLNSIGYNKGKINANSYLIQLDVTPQMEKGSAADLKIAFKIGENFSDERLQVRFQYQLSKLYIERISADQNGNVVDNFREEVAFNWEKNKTYAVDILVDSENNIIVYLDQTEILKANYSNINNIELKNFAIISQFLNQNFVIKNLKITTNENVDTGSGDEGNPETKNHLNSLSRILAEDSFEDGSNWSANSNTNIIFADGKATIKGSGANNRMGYQVGRINANDFLIQLDLTPNEGNTNSNAKIAFKIADQYEGDRLQVRFNFVQNYIYIERTINNNVNNTAADSKDCIWREGKSFTFQKGKTYGVDILVQGNLIKLYLDGNETPIFEVTNDDIGSMGKGYFAIAGQFPNQDFSIDNLKITTNEVQTGEQYTVALKVVTDGDESNTSGGTLTASAESGYSGDLITLFVNPAHGYVFDRFESFKENGTSTDGLMPITNNTFQIDPKMGNVTVVAHFKTRQPGRFELFYDDFSAASLLPEYKTVGNQDAVVQKDGVLTFDIIPSGSNFVLLNQDIFQPLKEGEGYRISADVWKGDSTAGTVQIMFKGSDDSISGRYVLLMNGSLARFKYLDNGLGAGADTDLTHTNFTFSTSKIHIALEVRGNRATFYVNDKELLSYTATDNWLNRPNAVGLLNMTPNAPVVFDNLLVERLPEQTQVTVKVMREENGVQIEDTTGISGTVSLSTTNVVEGDTVTLSAIEKAGYQLKEYYAENSSLGIQVEGDTFVVPGGISETICIIAVFERAAQKESREYYIDSAAGDDSNAGTIDAPWKTLDPLKAESLTLTAGDCVYLKRGSTFNGQQLSFKGMGSKEKPIIIDAYGEGDSLPQLNGNGVIENVVSLYNQEYIELRNLEITNTSPKYNSSFGLNTSNNSSLALRAINVSARDFGTVSGIRIQDCYIHDINGSIGLKWNGGIFFDVKASVINGELVGIPTKYDDVIIEGCTFINVDRSGIKLVSSNWCNQWGPNAPDLPIHWYPSTNIIIRNNYFEKIGGDGITTRDTDGTLIEHNLVKDCRYQSTGYNVGIWPFQASNTVIQYNEAYNTHGTEDGQGLDCDHASSYSVMQYNYSHNNEGGFMLIMGGYPHTAATVRYNISQNDRDKGFEFAQGIARGIMIYNNTLYSDQTLNRGVLWLPNTKSLGVNDLYLFNNVFCYPEGQVFSKGADASLTNTLKEKAKLYNNAYVGGIAAADADTNPIVIADKASVFADPGSAPETNDTKTARTGSSGLLDGYQLADGSELIDKGVTIQEALTHFGNGAVDIVDGRELSPNSFYYLGTNADSIKYVMGENFPDVNGVCYDIDFFGNSNKEGEKPDIGAAEYMQHKHEGGTATCAAKAICTICGTEYGELDPDNHSFVDYKSDENATCTEDGTKTAVCENGCGTKDTIADEGSAKGHSGGTATCISRAVCEICNLEYGELDAENHTGETEIRNAKEPTKTETGYTGDLYCKSCNTKLEEGKIIDKLPDESETSTTEEEETTKEPETSTTEEEETTKEPETSTTEEEETTKEPETSTTEEEETTKEPETSTTEEEETTKEPETSTTEEEETTKEQETSTAEEEETTEEPEVPTTSSNRDDDDDDDDYEPETETTVLTEKEENLVADTVGITSVKDVVENTSGKLITSDNSEIVFLEKDGTLSKDKWQEVDGAWYFFDKDSKASSGWLEQNGKWYHLNENNKKMDTDWLKTTDGKWYLLDQKNGDMKTGWQKTANGKWYLLDHENGDMKTGWQKTADGKWYLLDHENGDMKTGWQRTADGKWYLLDQINGDMKTGWQILNGIWYYLTESGAMAEDTITPDGYKVGKNGAWTGEKVR